MDEQTLAKTEAERLHRWQLRLLPLIVRILLGVACFFFLVSLVQIVYLHQRIAVSPSVDLTGPLRLMQVRPEDPIAERRAAAELMVASTLEVNAMQRRYHQANVIVMARVWTTYLGFVTGMALALVGAAFILGRVQGTETRVAATLGEVRAELATALPGMVLVVLGVALMAMTLFVKYTISVADGAVYLERRGRATTLFAPAPAPDLHLPSDTTAPEATRESP